MSGFFWTFPTPFSKQNRLRQQDGENPPARCGSAYRSHDG
ncbi:hypothetical protein CYA_0460 [Synechococcus sp. JA-3-3Ab]|nr:hypothetical protein CYA_0460 [Synechococcus sp. JA-3-3Ab]